VTVGDGEIVGGEGEGDSTCRAGGNSDTMEGAKLHEGLYDGGNIIVQVELYDFFAVASACIGDVEGDGKRWLGIVRSVL